MSEVWAILVAGGTGTRFSASHNKLLACLNQKPVILRSATPLATHPKITGLVVVSPPAWEETYHSLLSPLSGHTQIRWACGGPTRRDSVYNGLKALPDSCTVVLIHDAARPLVQSDKIDAALTPVLSEETHGTSLGLPSQNTLKQVTSPESPWVTETLDRSRIWQVHTPQVFLKATLLTAHETLPQDARINDDAELVERLYPNQNAVLMVQDSPSNLKITTPQDLLLAEAYLATVASSLPA